MSQPTVCLAAVLSAAMLPVAAAQASIAIDRAVECIVAGKFPRLNSCFHAQQRRGTGAPRKDLVGKHVEYYLQVSDRSFNESRTAEYNPVVVGDEQDCKDKPIAPYLSKASVQVFPGLPAGFAAGGVGAAAGVAAAGAGIAAAAGGSDSSTTTTSASRRSSSRARAKPGTWKFELAPTASLQPGSIRVIAGYVAVLTSDAVTFRLTGQPGERIVFTFKTGR